MCKSRGHPSGWPKLPAGPPKLLEVLNSLSEVLYESQISLTRIDRFFEHFQNLQRAVNRQPWLPREGPVETRITQHDRLHDDVNQHDEIM